MSETSSRPSVEELIAHRKIWPVAEAAVLLGVHRVTLYKRAAAGEISLVKIANRAYVTAEELDRYVSEVTPYVPGERVRNSAKSGRSGR